MSKQLIVDNSGYVTSVLSLKSVLMGFKKNLAEMSSRNVYDFSYKHKAVVWVRVVDLFSRLRPKLTLFSAE